MAPAGLQLVLPHTLAKYLAWPARWPAQAFQGLLQIMRLIAQQSVLARLQRRAAFLPADLPQTLLPQALL